MVEFCDQIGKPIQLLYYPPYHSKYNPRHHWVSACDAHFASAIAPIFGHHQHLQAASHHHRTLRERGVGDASIVTTRLVTRSLLKLRPYSAALQRLGGGLVAATAIAILLGWDVQVQLWLAPLFPAAPLNSSDIQVDQLFKEFDYEIATLF